MLKSTQIVPCINIGEPKRRNFGSLAVVPLCLALALTTNGPGLMLANAPIGMPDSGALGLSGGTGGAAPGGTGGPGGSAPGSNSVWDNDDASKTGNAHKPANDSTNKNPSPTNQGSDQAADSNKDAHKGANEDSELMSEDPSTAGGVAGDASGEGLGDAVSGTAKDATLVTKETTINLNNSDELSALATNVATFNGTDYPTLKDAFSAASAVSGKTITLTSDIVMTTSDTAKLLTGQATLDMAGHKITVDSAFSDYAIINRGKLTITGNGTIDISASDNAFGVIQNDSNSTLEVQNGRFISNSSPYSPTIDNGSAATFRSYGGYYEGSIALQNKKNAYIYKGEFKSTACVKCNPIGTVENFAIVNRDNSYMEISPASNEDVVVRGTNGAISVFNSSTLKISGGTFKTEACKRGHTSDIGPALVANGQSGGNIASCIIDGGVFSAQSAKGCLSIQTEPKGTSNLTINSGKFSNTGGSKQLMDDASQFNLMGTKKITGGEFALTKAGVADTQIFNMLSALPAGDVQIIDTGTMYEIHTHKRTPMGTIAANCLTAGSTGGEHCNICGKVYVAPTTTAAALGHTYGAWVVKRPAAVGVAGLEERECTFAGCPKDGTHIESRVLAALSATPGDGGVSNGVPGRPVLGPVSASPNGGNGGKPIVRDTVMLGAGGGGARTDAGDMAKSGDVASPLYSAALLAFGLGALTLSCAASFLLRNTRKGM